MALAVDESTVVLREVEQAEGYIASICFKTGPPTSIGAELEWTVHHVADPTRPLTRTALAEALGPHAPPAVLPDSPHLPLAHGGTVTVEPGGQVELSSRPHADPAQLRTRVGSEVRQLTDLLAASGLELGGTGLDPHRPPGRVLHSPRYDAMASYFARTDAVAGSGAAMMCTTAGLQVCLDAGPAAGLAERWAMLHEVGPALVAAFANSGHDGWASSRMRTWAGIDPARTRPVPPDGDPAWRWARYALEAPLLCIRRPGGVWDAPPGLTFEGWIRSGGRPTVDDLNYHLTTLFPPIRPRGYLEVRYLDTQPPDAWFTPVAVVAALIADPVTVDSARDISAPVKDRWLDAARFGLADRSLAKAAADLCALAGFELEETTR